MVRPGYKRTEVGEIPEDWEVRSLGRLVSFLDGQRRPVKDSDRAKMQGPIPYYGASGIVDWVNDYLFDEDLILLGEDGENILSRNCRLAFRISGKAWVNNHAHVLRPNNGVSIGFLCDYLESLDYASRNSGTAQPKLNRQACEAIPVALPPTAREQSAIATALEDADEMVESLEELLAKKRAIKQGAMQSLLTGAKRLPGFTEPWRTAAVGDLGRWVGGMTPSMQNGEYWKDGVVPWISSSDVKSTHLHSTGSRVTNLAITEKATTLVPRGSVVLVTRSGILRRFLPVAITLVPMAINQDIRALLPSQAVLPAFALQMLVFHDSGIRSACMKSGTTVESLEMKWLKAYRVGMPTPAEQAAIAEVLADLDADLDATTAKLDKARAIKQGMMQELLTGRIRLV